MTVDDNGAQRVDALTAKGGFLADIDTSGTDALADLAQQHRELQARYRGVIDRLPAVLYIDGVNDGDTMVDVGPGITELLGLTREEWLATPEGWRDVMHPDDLDRIVDASERSVATGEPFREQYRAIHRDGREVWIREEAIRVDDDEGNPQFWLGLMFDISDSVRTERELVDAQTRYGALVEHIPAIVYVDLADERMTTTYVSPQIESLLGITPRSTWTTPTCGKRISTPMTATEPWPRTWRVGPTASRSPSSTGSSRATGACCGSATARSSCTVPRVNRSICRA